MRVEIMTTIVYRDGIIAADSKVSHGSYFAYSMNKIIRVNGFIAGVCGYAVDLEELRKYLLQGNFKLRPGLCGNSDAIIYNGKHLWYVDNNSLPMRINKGFVACGSGYSAALGALHHGATAIEAVKVACKIDGHSGGKVRSLRIK